jgi:hypothetical protein
LKSCSADHMWLEVWVKQISVGCDNKLIMDSMNLVCLAAWYHCVGRQKLLIKIWLKFTWRCLSICSFCYTYCECWVYTLLILQPSFHFILLQNHVAENFQLASETSDTVRTRMINRQWSVELCNRNVHCKVQTRATFHLGCMNQYIPNKDLYVTGQ